MSLRGGLVTDESLLGLVKAGTPNVPVRYSPSLKDFANGDDLIRGVYPRFRI